MDIKKIRFDEFTSVVQPDPKSLKEVIYLEGYIGKSNEANHVRLFFDRALTDFIDIDSEDILHAVPNAKEEDTLGGSKLWIRAKASYKYGDPELKKRPEAGFMEGDIYEAYRKEYEAAIPQEQMLAPNTVVLCTRLCPPQPPQSPNCMTPGIPCTAVCKTYKFPCPVTPRWPCFTTPRCTIWTPCTRTWNIICPTKLCSPNSPCCPIPPRTPFETPFEGQFTPYGM